MSHNRLDCQRNALTMVANAMPTPTNREAIPTNLRGASHIWMEVMVDRVLSS